jgi:hypothetical protein
MEREWNFFNFSPRLNKALLVRSPFRALVQVDYLASLLKIVQYILCFRRRAMATVPRIMDTTPDRCCSVFPCPLRGSWQTLRTRTTGALHSLPHETSDYDDKLRGSNRLLPLNFFLMTHWRGGPGICVDVWAAHCETQPIGLVGPDQICDTVATRY